MNEFPALPECNGWTNYPTWNVHLWLANDNQALYHEAREMAQQGPSALREWVESFDSMPITGMFVDLSSWALSYVNWNEIAEALTEE